MKEGFLEYKNSQIHFTKFGIGEKLLIALHGFGDRDSSFLALKPALKKEYTVYAIDLPFHGQTRWQSDSFSRKEIIDLFELILNREHKQRFELLGYSFGGRLILASLLDIIVRVDKIYLVAPEGIRAMGMSSALIIPVWLRKALKRWINNPETVSKILRVAYKIGLLSKFNFHFIQHNLNSKHRQERIFNTWVTLKNFEVDLKKVKELLKENAIPVELYFGKHDKIIPLEAGERLADGIPNVHLNIINEGHLLLNEKLNELIEKQLNET
jgi:pimeloyl-ACP methyl ester carboxylesterase